MAERPKLNTSEAVIQALRQRHHGDAWGFLTEVANGTGGHKSRSADALAMSLWPSRGLEIHGFEVKVSRSDWKSELANPAKADAIARFCDRWWLVVGDEVIVQPGELPPTWGLMIPGPRGGLTVKVQAPELKPEPISRPFLAALFRRISESKASEAAIRAAVEAERAEWEELRQRERARAAANDDARVQTLTECISAFEKASGVSLGSTWQAGQIGEAVKTILAHDRKWLLHNLKETARHAKTVAEQAETAVRNLEEAARG